MKILLIGAGGQVGQELEQLLAHDRVIELLACDRTSLDLTQPQAIADQVAAFRPQVIVNAAAYTAVDKAEAEPDLAQAINALAPGALAQAATQVGASLVHISTDYVFDGIQSVPYQEDSPCNPLGVYGDTKRAGEVAVMAACDRHIILRTAWVYGAKGKGNFAKTILRLAQERDRLRVVYDQIGTPTWAYDIARAIVALLPQLGPETYGTYHFTNSGVASWYDFAVAIVEEAQVLGLPLTLEEVEPITTADYPTPARRPAYSVLSGEKIAGMLGTTPPHWRQSLRQMLSELYGSMPS
ncbi:dTDP-4-dehydrorhamnose reductase [Nodosilinea sp. E11]|uniref:dTDP-4-dehydrorhamnose reductase n=1 Tax=Nodosilinea sp. E11 TaxID=3037479 RepID=UPI002935257C|nr:dTDP-4-dehydrorhamnose reductase [Nodosilinea sp. E11]WOD40414.1 dTDP-4-dehydrorhamnose reductase [Nodosilinea sp. E11]